MAWGGCRSKNISSKCIAFSSSVTPLHRLAQVPGARYLPNHKAHGPVDAFDDGLSLDSGIPALGALSELEHQVGIILYRTRDLYFCEKIHVRTVSQSISVRSPYKLTPTTAATRRQLSHLARPLAHSAQG